MNVRRSLWILGGVSLLAGMWTFAVAPARPEVPFVALPRPSELEGGLQGFAQYPEWCKAFGYTKTLLDKDAKGVIPADLRRCFEASLESPWAAPCLWLFPDEAHMDPLGAAAE